MRTAYSYLVQALTVLYGPTLGTAQALPVAGTDNAPDKQKAGTLTDAGLVKSTPALTPARPS